MKKYFICCVLGLITSISAVAQLKINHFGGVGLGIEPRSDYKLMIKGNLMLTTYPEIPPPLERYTEFRFKVGNGWPGCEFGTPTRKIAVWSSEVGYNDLYAAHFYTQSDSALKTNINPIQNGLQTIMQIQPYSYFMRDTLGGQPSSKKEYGFIAQEIANILPEITDSGKFGILLLNYQQIAPFIVAAIQEQENIIDSIIESGNQKSQLFLETIQQYQQYIYKLAQEIDELKNQITDCCSLNKENTSLSEKDPFPESKLLQNRPNPFSEKTVIEFEINQVFRSAHILIFDMQGALKQTIPISNTGKGEVSINGFELSPGMYLYSLIIDDKEIDTKRMILLD